MGYLILGILHVTNLEYFQMPPRRKKWCKEDMKRAVDVVRKKEMGYVN